MKITLLIEDATPDEAGMLLVSCGVSGALVRARNKIKEEEEKKPVSCDGCHPKPCSGCRFEMERCEHRPYAKGEHICRFFEEPVPDPEHGHTGCEDCPDNGQDPECDMCSPPLSKQKEAVPVQNDPPTHIDMRHYPHQNTGNLGRNKGMKYGSMEIPFSSTKDRAAYQVAVRLCKKYGLPYPEAKAKDDALKQSVKAMPLSNEQKAPAPVTMDALSPNTIATGMHVRQIKPDQGRQIFGNALVLTRRNGGLIEVRNGGGKKHVIDARCLEIVPAGVASEKATGVVS